MKIPKDGFLYIDLSNQSTGKEVSFDNLDIKHVPGNVLEENHYYPYGLLIEQLSSKNPIILSQNSQKYQSKQLRDELSMNLLDFGARQYDAVLGRWIVQDPMRQYSNPYIAMGNNPSNLIDPSGMSAYSYGVTTMGYGDYSCGGGGGAGGANTGTSGGDNTDVYGSRSQSSGNTRVWYDAGSDTYFKGTQPISKEEYEANFPYYEILKIKDWYSREEINGKIGPWIYTETTYSLSTVYVGQSSNGGAELRGSMDDWGNYLGFGFGAAEYNVGKIMADRAKYTFNKAPYETRIQIKGNSTIRTPIRNVNLNISKLANGLKWGGRALGAFGLGVTAARAYNGEISYGEATLDATFGIIGFLGPVGFIVSSTYFFVAKPLYEYTTKE